jgi:predicted lipoprotein with Yx(FWY)xxD motif
MRSTRFSIAILAAGAALAMAACGGGTAAGTPATSGGAALLHTTSMKVGDKTQTVLKNTAGLTLYYFTPDTSSAIACTGGCATTWPPLHPGTGDPTSSTALPGRLSVIDGANGKQIAYNGHPLYTYSKDGDSGDAYGQGIGGKWFVATPELASATASPSSSGYNY